MKVLEAIEVKLNRMSRKNKARIGTAIYLLAFPLLLLLPPNQLSSKIATSVIWLLVLIIMLVERIYGENKSHPIYRIKEQFTAAVKKYVGPICLAVVYTFWGAKVLEVWYYEGAEAAGEWLNILSFACMVSVLICEVYFYVSWKKTTNEGGCGLKYLWAIYTHVFATFFTSILYITLEWFPQFLTVSFPAIALVFSGWVWTYDMYRKSSDSSKEQPQT